jgi:hypothetical protein
VSEAVTVSGLNADMVRIAGLIDNALDTLRDNTREFAVAEDAYRMAHAKAYLSADGPAHQRKALADLATSAERQAAHLADGMRQAALEAVRARRAQLSALQSIAAAHRAEAEFDRTRPAGVGS